jgi:hypothetical protein
VAAVTPRMVEGPKSRGLLSRFLRIRNHPINKDLVTTLLPNRTELPYHLADLPKRYSPKSIHYVGSEEPSSATAGCSDIGLCSLLEACLLLYKYRVEETNPLKYVRK